VGTTGRDPKATERVGKTPFASRTLGESLSYAWNGLVYVYSSERNMRIHIFIASLVVSLCIVVGEIAKIKGLKEVPVKGGI